MRKFLRNPKLHIVLLLLPFIWAYATADAQPVPRQEQDSRLILALEQHNRALAENTRALQELTQQLRMQR